MDKVDICQRFPGPRSVSVMTDMRCAWGEVRAVRRVCECVCVVVCVFVCACVCVCVSV